MIKNKTLYLPERGKEDSLRRRLVYLLSIMTIEPMMFVQGLAGGISSIATEQMTLYKICRGNIRLYYRITDEL